MASSRASFKGTPGPRRGQNSRNTPRRSEARCNCHGVSFLRTGEEAAHHRRGWLMRVVLFVPPSQYLARGEARLQHFWKYFQKRPSWCSFSPPLDNELKLPQKASNANGEIGRPIPEIPVEWGGRQAPPIRIRQRRIGSSLLPVGTKSSVAFSLTTLSVVDGAVDVRYQLCGKQVWRHRIPRPVVWIAFIDRNRGRLDFPPLAKEPGGLVR